MNLFNIDKENSYYTISPTRIMIPPIISENQKVIREKSFLRLDDFDRDVTGVRLLLDVVPKEFNKDVNESIYRLYSTWCDADTKDIDEKSYFEVSNLQNEVTITYYLSYSTKSDIQLECILLMIFTPIFILGGVLTKANNKKQKIVKLIIFIGILGALILSYLSLRPEGYHFTFLDLMVLFGIILGMIVGFILRKIWKKPLCPICGKNGNVRKRIRKKPKWRCAKCKFAFDTLDAKKRKIKQ